MEVVMPRRLLRALLIPAAALLGLQLATQHVAATFGYHPALGAPLGVLFGWRWYGWWRFPGWIVAFGSNHPLVFHRGFLIVCGTVLLGIVVGFVLRVRRRQDAPGPTTHGSAAWATDDDVQGSGLV
jgi:type IV secretion system protein VirD4